VHILGVVGGISLVGLVAWAIAGGTRGASERPWTGDYTDAGGLAVWLITSVTEPQFYAVPSAGVCLLLGGLFAHLAQRSSWRWQGFVQACGTGVWPWVAGSALASLLLSNLAWGWTLDPGVWQPLFVPLVSAAPAMVVLYGPGWGTSLTAAVCGAALTPPAAILAVEYVCKPWDLPAVVGATTGMWVGALAAFSLCRLLPWMPAPGEWRSRGVAEDDPAVGTTQSQLWVPRRALADFSEAQFFGNEWASAAMILGAVVAYVVSPSALVYGSGLFLAVLSSQALTALTGVLIWRRRWNTLGFYPTFVPVVSVAPATVLAYGGTIQSVAAGALAGALIAPPVAAAISGRLPGGFHPFIGNVASMSLCTALIVPLLELLPGIAS
jgi:MFS transporter, ENTS family, enterobactin (siderophore) exporter